jgi:hypothetical protein
MVGLSLAVDGTVVGIIRRDTEGRLVVVENEETGVILLNDDGKELVTSHLKTMSDDDLISKVKAYENMPTCLHLARQELSLRGYAEKTVWVKETEA